MERTQPHVSAYWLFILILCCQGGGHYALAQPPPTVEIHMESVGDSMLLPTPSGGIENRTLLVTFHTKNPLRSPRYEFQILESDNMQWIICDEAHQVVLAYLRGGKQTIEVRDIANQVSSKLEFEIERSIFESFWIWVLGILYLFIVTTIVFYLLFLYRYQQKLRLLRMREHVARDLHDDMGSQLSSISIMSQNMEQMARQNPELARKAMARIGETARQVMDNMSDIVWSVNPENDSLGRIVERMKDYGSELFDMSTTKIEFKVDCEVLKSSLSLDKRRDFFLIFKEALANAARYAEAKSVQVEIEHTSGFLRLIVRDDGQGFDPTCPPQSKGGNGLQNMKSRAAKIGADLRLDSAARLGTSVILTLPVH